MITSSGFDISKMLTQSSVDKPQGIVLGGGQVGCEIIWALNGYRRIRDKCTTALVWPDLHNNSRGRYLNFYGNETLSDLPQETAALIEGLPQFGDRPNPLVGRVVEQTRLFHCLRDWQFPEERIVAARYSNELMLELIDRFNIDFAIVGAFGGIISDEVVERLNDNIWVCHPTFELSDKDRYLPQESRGAGIIEKIISEPLPRKIQIAMMKVRKEIDGGPVVAVTHTAGSIYIAPWERGPEKIPLLVHRVIEQIAVMTATLIRYNLLPQLFDLEELVGRFSVRTLIKMGYAQEEIEQARKQKKKKKRKNKG